MISSVHILCVNHIWIKEPIIMSTSITAAISAKILFSTVLQFQSTHWSIGSVGAAQGTLAVPSPLGTPPGETQRISHQTRPHRTFSFIMPLSQMWKTTWDHGTWKKLKKGHYRSIYGWQTRCYVLVEYSLFILMEHFLMDVIGDFFQSILSKRVRRKLELQKWYIEWPYTHFSGPNKWI